MTKIKEVLQTTRITHHSRYDTVILTLSTVFLMTFENILTQSPVFQAVLRSAHLIAQTEASVLITGESGTGKELVAHAIHQASPRHNQTFTTVNCAALPETLAESLLFGHRKGAFTGADTAQQGLLASANNGTVFLDEIGELPLTLQAKLLRFLESGEILPIGDNHSKHVNVRVLAATHRDLYQMSQSGNFREDLFYRLNVVPVELPPLRERKEDIELLANHFLQHFAKQHRLTPAVLDKSAKHTLQRYTWTGNVRELKNTCERLSILLAGQTLHKQNLPSHIQITSPQTSVSPFRLPAEGIQLQELERDLMSQALERTQQNKSHAARLLGISRDALNYRLKKHR